MNEATIQQRPCPRCAIRRTVPQDTFTAAETARLAMYRAAVRAGFYSDQVVPLRHDSSGSHTLLGTVMPRQPMSMSAANNSVIDAQLSEWLAPQRR
jgi:hypothetical protein